jgi:hypothetical protein
VGDHDRSEVFGKVPSCERRDESAFKEVGGLETEVFQAEGAPLRFSE